MSSYNSDLNKNAANYVPLTPLTFIKRAKEIYPDYEAIIYEDRKYSWAEVYKRTEKFASAISKIGISSTPSIFLPDGKLILGYKSPKDIIGKIKN